MITRYDAIYLAAAPVGLPYLAWRWARRGKYRRSAPGMLGRHLPRGEAARPFQAGSVWIHAVSVGEVAAARAIEPGLRGLFPRWPFVVSTVTETGQEAARRSLPGVEAFTYFPADLSWNVARYHRAFRPRVIFILESEIWPNFLLVSRRAGTPVFLVNGRLSDRSFPRYRRFRDWFRPAFEAFAGLCVQTEEDAGGFRALGFPEEKVRVTGNVKFDLPTPTLTDEERRAARRAFGINAADPVIVAGSTHPGEEETVLNAFQRLREDHPQARLILVPRHPERFEPVAELCRAWGFATEPASRLSSGSPVDRGPEIVVLDRMGELARAYGLGDVAIVAGSFGNVGGHNLLEAAAHAIPVVYGPNMANQREMAALFAAAAAGTQVRAAELGATLLRLLNDPELRRAEGLKARRVVEINQGSAGRAIEAVRGWLRASGALPAAEAGSA